jgi:hypothetical protein
MIQPFIGQEKLGGLSILFSAPLSNLFPNFFERSLPLHYVCRPKQVSSDQHFEWKAIQRINMLSTLHPIDLLARDRREPREVDDFSEHELNMSERTSSSKKLVKRISSGSERGDKESQSAARKSSIENDGDDPWSAERAESISSNHSVTSRDGSSKQKKRSAKKEKSDGSDKRRRDKGQSRLGAQTSNDGSYSPSTPHDTATHTDDIDKKRKRKSAEDGRKRRNKTSRKVTEGKDSAQLSDGSSVSDGHPDSDDALTTVATAASEIVSHSSSSSTTSLHLDIGFTNDAAGGPQEKRSPTTPKKSSRPMPITAPSNDSNGSHEDSRPPPRVMPLVPPAASAEDSLDSSMMTSVPPEDDSDEEPMSSWFGSYDERFPNRLSSDSLSRRRGRSNHRHRRTVAAPDDPRHSVSVDFPSSPSQRRPSSRERTSSSDDLSKKHDERVRINVGGRTFETFTGTLRKYPNTLLGTMFHPRFVMFAKRHFSVPLTIVSLGTRNS